MTTDLPILDVTRLTDSELLAILELPEGRDGLRHYMSKDDKVAWLQTPTKKARAEILERARQAQVSHHRYLRECRAAGGPPNRPALIEEKLGHSPWRYIERVKTVGSFRDEVTGRKAKIAYVIENTESGARLRVTKSTVQDAYERLGNMLNWPPPRGGRTRPKLEGPPTAAALEDRFAHLHRK